MKRSILAVMLTGFVLLGAVLGGVAMITDPTGASLGLPLSALDHSPFETYLVPGVVLLAFVGGTQALAGIAHILRSERATVFTLAAGIVLSGFLVVEMAMLRDVHWLQVLFGLIGIAEMGVAVGRLMRDQREFIVAES